MVSNEAVNVKPIIGDQCYRMKLEGGREYRVGFTRVYYSEYPVDSYVVFADVCVDSVEGGAFIPEFTSKQLVGLGERGSETRISPERIAEKMIGERTGDIKAAQFLPEELPERIKRL
jgi:hypothetical protein